jgi:hypothetical protein
LDFVGEERLVKEPGTN